MKIALTIKLGHISIRAKTAELSITEALQRESENPTSPDISGIQRPTPSHFGFPSSQEPTEPQQLLSRTINACTRVLINLGADLLKHIITLIATASLPKQVTTAMVKLLRRRGFLITLHPLALFHIAIAAILIKDNYEALEDGYNTKWLVLDVGKYAKAVTLKTHGREAAILAMISDPRVSAETPRR